MKVGDPSSPLSLASVGHQHQYLQQDTGVHKHETHCLKGEQLDLPLILMLEFILTLFQVTC